MNQDIRKKIILKLIHQPEARFSDLWDKDIESNTFSYHLKKLEHEGLIEKGEEIYKLTTKGQKLTAFIEGDSGDRAALPTPTVVVVVKDDDKILAQKRLKEPFYGYHGFISGKINFGFNVIECARRDLMEEAGLEADFEFKGIGMTKTFNNNELAFHHFFHFVLATNPRGELKKSTHKSENFWININDIKNLERFPDFDDVVELLNQPRFFIRENTRFQEDGRFIKSEVTSLRFLEPS
ncbi:NUDIX domain-containing protein [Candidatus Woesearchaeota archaeon]|nr:NUDIX domain-containing protein [Candidatus Woesearchaeota archaeon]